MTNTPDPRDTAVRNTLLTGLLLAIPGAAALIIAIITAATGPTAESDPASWRPIGWGILAILWLITDLTGTIIFAAIAGNTNPQPKQAQPPMFDETTGQRLKH